VATGGELQWMDHKSALQMSGGEFLERRGVRIENFSMVLKTHLPDNAFIESFNGRLRQECLNQNCFSPLLEARETIENWRQDYNEYRPHRSLDQQTPSEFVAGWQQTRTDPKAGF